MEGEGRGRGRGEGGGGSGSEGSGSEGSDVCSIIHFLLKGAFRIVSNDQKVPPGPGRGGVLIGSGTMSRSDCSFTEFTGTIMVK